MPAMVLQVRPRAYAPKRRTAWVVAAAAAVLAGALVLVLWAAGGFARARPPQLPAGSEVENKLFRIEPRKAGIQTQDAYDGKRFQLVVRAELTSKEDAPQAAGTIQSMLEPRVSPGGAELEPDGVQRVRGGAARTCSWIQPGVTEVLQFSWELPKSVGSADAVQEVRLRVLEAEHADSFLDQEKQWRSRPERSAGDVALSTGG